MAIGGLWIIGNRSLFWKVDIERVISYDFTFILPHFIESGKTQINQKLFPLQRILLWTSHCEQDCPRVKKAKGRPSYQAKNNRRVLWNSCRTTSNTRHFLCWHSCGNCRWDWSKYVTTTVANFYEVSFLSLLTSTDYFRKESRAS